jgi:putative phosphoribosyl transferase
MPFVDRTDGGQCLARRLDLLRGLDVVVLGLPRGGVPVAFEVAAALDAPLDVLLVRKLGVPLLPELVMGAIGEDGVRIRNKAVMKINGVGVPEIAAVEQAERVELDRQLRRFRTNRPRVSVADRIVVVVDDGMTTGLSATVAARVVRWRGARLVFVAVPMSSPEAITRVRAEADEVVCLETTEQLTAVGQWYADSRQTTDDDVALLLASADA